jgi:hypothetical protein
LPGPRAVLGMSLIGRCTGNNGGVGRAGGAGADDHRLAVGARATCFEGGLGCSELRGVGAGRGREGEGVHFLGRGTGTDLNLLVTLVRCCRRHEQRPDCQPR